MLKIGLLKFKKSSCASPPSKHGTRNSTNKNPWSECDHVFSKFSQFFLERFQCFIFISKRQFYWNHFYPPPPLKNWLDMRQLMAPFGEEKFISYKNFVRFVRKFTSWIFFNVHAIFLNFLRVNTFLARYKNLARNLSLRILQKYITRSRKIMQEWIILHDFTWILQKVHFFQLEFA